MAEQEEPKVIYSKFRGNYNRDDSSKVLPTEKGVFLKNSVNTFADKLGGMHSREGYDILSSVSSKSFWSDGVTILGVYNGNFCRLGITGTTLYWSVLKYSVGKTRWYFKKVGRKVYATNNIWIGYFNLDDNSWNESFSTSATYKHVIPPGHILDWYKGSLCIGLDNGDSCGILFSDPTNPIIYDVRADKAFLKTSTRPTMIAPVKDGIWVGTKAETAFYQGAGVANFERTFSVPYGVKEGAYALDKGVVVNNEYYDNCVWFTSDKGICLGGNEGKFKNETYLNYSDIVGQEGFGFLRKGSFNQYISITR